MDVPGRGVQSVEVGGRILAMMAAAGGPVMLRDIASGAKVPPAQAHAYLVSFRKIGLVEQDGASGRYQLGPLALDLGLARLRSLNPLRLAGDAAAELAAELGLMVTLTVWGSFGATIVQVHEARDQLHVNLRPGAVYSLAGTATGRVFAAFLPPAIIGPRVKIEMRSTERTQRIGSPVDAARFRHDVAAVRQSGYATAIGSPVPGINAVSVPVFDHTGHLQLAMTLIGPAGLVDTGPHGAETQRVMTMATGLSSALGFKAAPRLEETATRARGQRVSSDPLLPSSPQLQDDLPLER